jgi:peptide/nickel transport system ATP-binding protein
MTTTQPAAGTASGQPGAMLEARHLTRHFTVSRGIAPRGRAGPRARRAAAVTGPAAADQAEISPAGALPAETGAAGANEAGRSGTVHAVDDVSITLAPGSITGLVGESGSGKSTLARLLAQLIPPSSGELLLDGAALTGGRRRHRGYARNVQLVLQDPFSSLNPVHDVRYHLARPLQVQGTCPPGMSLEGAITGLLDRVALTPASQFIRKYPHELSGGQRQRVAIARALAVQPRVLLADEPVSMLDVSIRLGVLNLLADLRENDGLTILYITHDIASARYLSDDIAVMYAGQLIESGPATAVTDSPAHPYTQLLLSAAPDPAQPLSDPLPGRGAAPSLLAPPSGCRFHPRCPHAMAICSAAAPPAALVAPGHVSSCWLHSPDQGGTSAQAPRAGGSDDPPPEVTDTA